MIERAKRFKRGSAGGAHFQPLEVQDSHQKSSHSSCKIITLKIMTTIHLIMMLMAVALFFIYVLLGEDQRLKPIRAVCVGKEAASDEFCLIAIGQFAYGFIAVGQVAIGVITISQVGIGLFFGLSQIGVSLFCAMGQIVTAPLIPICQHGIAGIRMKRALIGVQLYPFFFKEEEAIVKVKCCKRGDSK